jgi:hypothetical protein
MKTLKRKTAYAVEILLLFLCRMRTHPGIQTQNELTSPRLKTAHSINCTGGLQEKAFRRRRQKPLLLMLVQVLVLPLDEFWKLELECI